MCGGFAGMVSIYSDPSSGSGNSGTDSGSNNNGGNTNSGSGSNTDENCSASGVDPYSSGSKIACCSDLRECLKDWTNNNGWFWKCMPCNDNSCTKTGECVAKVE